jgi:hypothetical protein
MPNSTVYILQPNSKEVEMNKAMLMLALSSVMASGAFAQTGSGITMSTDPAKAAAVEQHAQELKARPAPQAQTKPAAKQSASKKTTKTHTKQGSTAAKPAAKK